MRGLAWSRRGTVWLLWWLLAWKAAPGVFSFVSFPAHVYARPFAGLRVAARLRRGLPAAPQNGLGDEDFTDPMARVNALLIESNFSVSLPSAHPKTQEVLCHGDASLDEDLEAKEEGGVGRDEAEEEDDPSAWPPPVASPDARSMAYFYLSSVLRLEDSAMLRITISYPSILGLSVNRRIRPSLRCLRDDLQLSPDAVLAVISKQPAVLQISPHGHLRPKIRWLREALVVTTRQLASIVSTFPAILTYSIRENLEPKVDYFQETLGFTPAEFGAMVRRFPSLLSLSLQRNLIPKVELLDEHLGLDRPALRRLLQRVPMVLASSMEQNLEPKVYYLRAELGFSPDQCARLLRLSPQVILIPLDETLIPLIEYLQVDLGFSIADVRRALLRFPRMPTYSLENKLKPRIEFLETSFDLEPMALRNFLCAAPQVLGVQLEDRLRSLREDLGMSDYQMRACVLGLPTVLTYSVHNNLIPKIQYMMDHTASTRDEVLNMCMAKPSVLGYSLEKRIAPRLEVLRVILERDDTEPVELDLLKRVVGMTEKTFINWLEMFDPVQFDFQQQKQDQWDFL
mmetsp:Transcript_10928/g.31353  ORF Transcript_10928/g.31353 Transcript_10928/m.31353 type:complete len:569 (-) Transcript_10928:32-1738(-)